ncbi:MAG: hypothetical protein JHC33_15370 [Ignisphaera sp.]|nr:hypothetical protein [Ignisphaera sp.]
MPLVATNVDSETYSRLLEIVRNRGVKLSELIREVLESYVSGANSGSGSSLTTSANLESLKELAEKVKDLEERVRIIEQVHWGVAEINKRVQVYDGDSEEGRKILEEIRQKGLKPVERSEGSGIAVEVYDT